MALSSSQIAHLIELVHSEDILWNISAKDYRDTYKKKAIWQRIGAKFNVDGDAVYKIFRSLREKYRREKEKEEKGTRSGSGSYRGSNWGHMEALRFLEEAHKKRRVYSSIEWEANTQNESGDSIKIELTCEHPDAFPPEDCPPFHVFSPSCSQAILTPQSTSQLKPDSRLSQKNICDNSLNSQSSSPGNFTASLPAIPSTSTTHPASQMQCSSPVDFHQQTPRIVRSRGPSPRKDMRMACLENILSENTAQLVNTLKSTMPPATETAPKPFSAFAEYIRQCLEDASPENAREMESEMLKIIIKYKFPNK